jgi:hypothetical protein
MLRRAPQSVTVTDRRESAACLGPGHQEVAARGTLELLLPSWGVHEGVHTLFF